MADAFRTILVDDKITATMRDDGTVSLFRYGVPWLSATSSMIAAVNRIAELEDALAKAKKDVDLYIAHWPRNFAWPRHDG